MGKRRSISLSLLGLLAGAGVGLYGARRRLFAKLLRLSPAHYKTGVQKDIAVQMPDGAVLLADHYFPLTRGSYPTILVRSPYGRGPEFGLFGNILTFQYARFAERGFNVIVQSTRGRFESGGEFEPIIHEAADGRATLDWILKQHWCNGMVGVWGPSYLGFTQWALATQGVPAVRALAPSITTADPRGVFFPDGVFALEVVLNWMSMLDAMDMVAEGRRWRGMQQIGAKRTLKKLKKGAKYLPLATVDQAILGKTVEYFQQWIKNGDPKAPYWEQMNFRKNLSRVVGSVNFVSGWYDLILRELLVDYALLKENGPTLYLTIGPWNHFSMDLIWETIREGINWFEATLHGNRGKMRRAPVRIYVMGLDEWREMESWPPPATVSPFYLHPEGVLKPESVSGSADATAYVYNPKDPTPALGGARFNQFDVGPQDNAPLEARPDVMCFTSPPLADGLEVIGPVRLRLFVRSSLEYTDFFGRLCDVSLTGVSTNVCDGLFRIVPGKAAAQPDGSLEIEVDMWSTAYYFAPGHRVRLQVSSGAHPRWVRNLGTGEDPLNATQMKSAHQQIFHDETHPSALLLPVTG